MVERKDVEEVKGVLERWHNGDSFLVLQRILTNGDVNEHLELCAHRHVVAKMLLHPVNLFSVGLHNRRQGHKVCPDSEFQVEVLEEELDPYFGNLCTNLAISGVGLLISDKER